MTDTPSDGAPPAPARKRAARRRKPRAAATPETVSTTAAAQDAAAPAPEASDAPVDAADPIAEPAAASANAGHAPAPTSRRKRGRGSKASAEPAAEDAVPPSAAASTPPAPVSPTRGAGAAANAPGEPLAPAAHDGPVQLIRVPLAVRWRDLDAFNHVNNSKYLSFLEEARLQWMLGLPGQGLDDHVAPVVAAAQLNYRRPIEWPAQVVIELFVERLGTTSVTVGHRILAAGGGEPVLYCDGHVVMVWIHRGSGTAAPLPTPVREACTAR